MSVGAGGFGTDGWLGFVSGGAAEFRTETGTDTWVEQDAHMHTYIMV